MEERSFTAMHEACIMPQTTSRLRFESKLNRRAPQDHMRGVYDRFDGTDTK